MKICISLIVFICGFFPKISKSQNISYILPDSVELKIKRHISGLKSGYDASIYFLLEKDSSDIYSLTVVPFSRDDKESPVLQWVKETTRSILVDTTRYPLLLDYDFKFGTPTPDEVGEIGHREGNVKKIQLIAHRYTVHFKMNGRVVLED